MSEGLPPSSIDVHLETGEATRIPEALGPQCQVKFILEDTLVDGSGAHALGLIRCDTTDCALWNFRTITGDVESGIVADSVAVAEKKVLSRARKQMTNECLVWTRDPANNGMDIPNAKLPQNLQRP